MLDACVRAFANVLSMSVTLCSRILLKCFEVFKLPLCSPIMERIILDLTAVLERVQGGETVSEAVVAIEENGVCPHIFDPLCVVRPTRLRYMLLTSTFTYNIGSASYYRKRGSASYIVREVHSVRERERERYRERRKWRHHCRAKIGDELTRSLCQKFAQLAMSLHFPFPKTRTFRFSLHVHFPSLPSLHGEVTIVALKFAMGSHFPLPKNFSPSLFPLFQMARAARRVIENPRQTIKSCPVDRISGCTVLLLIEKLNQINTKNYWK